MLTKHWSHQGLQECLREELGREPGGGKKELGQVLSDMALSQPALGTVRGPIGASVPKVRNQI